MIVNLFNVCQQNRDLIEDLIADEGGGLQFRPESGPRGYLAISLLEDEAVVLTFPIREAKPDPFYLGDFGDFDIDLTVTDYLLTLAALAISITAGYTSQWIDSRLQWRTKR